MSNLAIIMYHYVRPIKGSKFPKIKGLELDGFHRQLDYLQDRYNFVTVDEINYAIKSGKGLKDNSCWLTFDDGYKDHHQYVMPALVERGIEGAFFPPSATVTDEKLLDVNAIHHILASVNDTSALKNDLDQICLLHGVKRDLLFNLWNKYGKANRFDTPEVIYIKRLLQHALPAEIRHNICEQLFQKYMGMNMQDFASQLYMNKQEIIDLRNNGMAIGSHGSEHYWLNSISAERQREDINASLVFLEEIGVPIQDWVMCYPYGGFNDDTLKILSDLGASIGITTESRLANLASDHPLTLPRFDTNDFPQ